MRTRSDSLQGGHKCVNAVHSLQMQPAMGRSNALTVWWTLYNAAAKDSSVPAGPAMATCT